MYLSCLYYDSFHHTRVEMLCLQRIEGRTYDPSRQPGKILLKPTVTRFGRGNEHADVVIDSTISPLMISRIHAEIHCIGGKFRIDCKGLNGLLINRKKRSSAILCEADEIVFGGAGVKTKEGDIVSSYDSELVYVFTELQSPDNSEVANSLEEGTSDGRVLRRSKRKQPVSTCDELSAPPGKKSKFKTNSKEVAQETDHELTEKSDHQAKGSKEDERSKKCIAELNEELLCCICRELMVLAHTLPCSHTFCFGCIRDWLRQSGDCPNCRAAAQLTSAVPVKVLDNTINKVAEEVLSTEELEERKIKIQEVSEEVKKMIITKRKVLTLSSDSDSDGDNSDESDSDDSLDLEELFGGEEFHYDYRYGVEHARSGRAQCRTCFSLIPLRSVRWVVQFKTRWEHFQQTQYHHLDCFLPPSYITYHYLAISTELTRAERRLVKDSLEQR